MVDVKLSINFEQHTAWRWFAHRPKVIGNFWQREPSHDQPFSEHLIAEFDPADCRQVKRTIEKPGIDTKSMVQDSVSISALSMPNQGPHGHCGKAHISASMSHCRLTDRGITCQPWFRRHGNRRRWRPWHDP
jgi:hypothetical protein